ERVRPHAVSLLVEWRGVRPGRRARGRPGAVLADPVFGENDPRVNQASRSAAAGATRESGPADHPIAQSEVLRSIGETGGALERLPFARREAEAILRLPNNGGISENASKTCRHNTIQP